MLELIWPSLYLGSEVMLPKSDGTTEFYCLDYLVVRNLKQLY